MGGVVGVGDFSQSYAAYKNSRPSLREDETHMGVLIKYQRKPMIVFIHENINHPENE